MSNKNESEHSIAGAVNRENLPQDFFVFAFWMCLLLVLCIRHEIVFNNEIKTYYLTE